MPPLLCSCCNGLWPLHVALKGRRLCPSGVRCSLTLREPVPCQPLAASLGLAGRNRAAPPMPSTQGCQPFRGSVRPLHVTWQGCSLFLCCLPCGGVGLRQGQMVRVRQSCPSDAGLRTPWGRDFACASCFLSVPGASSVLSVQKAPSGKSVCDHPQTAAVSSHRVTQTGGNPESQLFSVSESIPCTGSTEEIQTVQAGSYLCVRHTVHQSGFRESPEGCGIALQVVAGMLPSTVELLRSSCHVNGAGAEELPSGLGPRGRIPLSPVLFPLGALRSNCLPRLASAVFSKGNSAEAAGISGLVQSPSGSFHPYLSLSSECPGHTRIHTSTPWGTAQHKNTLTQNGLLATLAICCLIVVTLGVFFSIIIFKFALPAVGGQFLVFFLHLRRGS